MKISVVCTVKNEDKTIATLLLSLLSQTRKPDEIVIVDGESHDQTAEIIKGFQKNNKNIRLIVEHGSIAHGRNVSIKNARHDIIAQIDAGCIAKKDWLKKITEPFKDENVGLVAGFYEMTGESSLQKALAPFHGVTKERFDPRFFLPSGRSMAFRKSVWEMVGGYSEKLDRAGEDTLFNYHILQAGVKIVRRKDAVVFWEVPDSLITSARKLFHYAKGDAQAGIWWHPAQKMSTHNIKITIIFVRYILGLFLLFSSLFLPFLFYILIVGFIFYFLWSIWKLQDIVSDMHAKMWIPIVQFTSDLSVMAGFMAGIIGR